MPGAGAFSSVPAARKEAAVSMRKVVVAPVVCALVVAAGLGCDSAGPQDGGTIFDLTVQVIDGGIHADLMPPVPPDPVVCHLVLRVVNTDTDDAVSGVTIPSGSVFLSRTGEELGAVRFETAWDGWVGAGEVDTVTVVKIAESQELFAPPCGQGVFLRVNVVKTAVQTKQVTTPSYVFSCPVTGMGENSRRESSSPAVPCLLSRR